MSLLGAACIVQLPYVDQDAPLPDAGDTTLLVPASSDDGVDADGSTGHASPPTHGDADTGSDEGSAGANESGESDGGRDAGTSTGDPDVDSGSDPPPPANDGECCAPAENDGVGCADPAIAACVCAVDSACCELGWDELCVDQIVSLDCGACGFGPASLGPPSCCDVQPTPSCADEPVASCVCASDPYCCDIVWDQVCVDAVTSTGCGTCDAVDADEAILAEDACCSPSAVPGCLDPSVDACVCALDDYCCTTAWDELCVDQATFYCGACVDDDSTSGGSSTDDGDPYSSTSR